MKQKIHRGSRTFRRRRSVVPKVLGGLLAAALLITGGYFGAKWIVESRDKTPSSGTVSSIAPSAPESSLPEGSEDPSAAPSLPSEDPTPEPTGDRIAAVHVTVDVLRQTEQLEAVLAQAKADGRNAVVFDLKDADGNLLYAFTSEQALLSDSIAEDALTAEQLQTALKQIADGGFDAIPRLYAFQDHTAPYRLTSARVQYSEAAGVLWLDKALANGGRPWLNPYSNDAHIYLTALIEELAAMDGISYLMLDGVRFPSSVAYASFGSDNATLSRAQVLSLFVERAKTAAGDVPVILCADSAALFGNDTKVYGDNPLTFGADMVATDLRLSALPMGLTLGSETIADPSADPVLTLQKALTFIGLRMQVLEQAPSTVVVWVETESVADEVLTSELQAVDKAEAGYVLSPYPSE